MGVKEALAVLGRAWKVGSGDTGNESECMSGVRAMEAKNQLLLNSGLFCFILCVLMKKQTKTV